MKEADVPEINSGTLKHEPPPKGNIYSSGTLDARLVLADIRTLMREK